MLLLFGGLFARSECAMKPKRGWRASNDSEAPTPISAAERQPCVSAFASYGNFNLVP